MTTHDAVLFAGEGMQLLPPGLHSHVHGHEDTFPTFLDLRQLALLDIFKNLIQNKVAQGNTAFFKILIKIKWFQSKSKADKPACDRN